jgi:hypothetical protein
MGYLSLLIAILVVGAIWMTALGLAIALYYSNLKKYRDEKEKPFQGNYFRRFIIVSILVPAIITAAVIVFFILNWQ